jgi:hypothetical protein
MNLPDVTPFIFLAVKIIIILGLFMYLIFAGILYRQEQLMANVLEEGFEPFLRLLTIIHLIGSVVVLGLAFVLL